jgi:hypothetical protein
MDRQDVIRLAFRRLGMGVNGEPVQADWRGLASDYVDAILGELEGVIDFTEVDIPARALLPLADVIAADLAPAFSMAAPRSRHMAKLALLAAVRPDDRTEIAEPVLF